MLTRACVKSTTNLLSNFSMSANVLPIWSKDAKLSLAYSNPVNNPKCQGYANMQDQNGK